MDITFLTKALLSIDTEDEMNAFLHDLCTPGELRAMSQRIIVAKKLYRGDTYETIHSESGLSSATIARINAELQYGKGGYRTVIEKLERS